MIRTSQDGPFCWQSKEGLRKIRDAFDATGDVSSALMTYVALTEIASDLGIEPFTTTHAWISKMSGYSRRTVQLRLKELEELGLIEISTPSLRAPCTYTICNHCATLRTDNATLRSGMLKQASMRTSEERQKKGTEEKEEEPYKKMIDPPIELPESLRTPEFQSVWESWEKHRKEIHHKLTPSTTIMQLKKLGEMGQVRAIAAIENSICHGWQALIEPKSLVNVQSGSNSAKVDLKGRPYGHPLYKYGENREPRP